jgi:hypothetical protein
MPFFDDFGTEVARYPTLSVKLSIVDRVVQPPGTAGAVNVNEVFAFQVRVANTGNLNLTNVRLRVQGLNGAKVGFVAGGPFASSILAPTIPAVNAKDIHGQDTVNLFFKAPSVPTPATDTDHVQELIKVHIADYDVNLNHILNNITTDSPAPSIGFSTQVFP